MWRRTQKFKVSKLHMRTRTTGVMLGLLLAHFVFCNLLMRCGDVESNPGPGSKDRQKDTLRQTRLQSASAGGGSGRRESLTNNNNSGNNSFSNKSNDNTTEPTLKDILSKLVSMEGNIDKKLGGLRDEMVAAQEKMRADVQELMQEVAGLREENASLKKRNDDLEARVGDMEDKLDDLEGRSRRNNVLFYGLPKPSNETGEACEKTVQEFLKSKMGLNKDVQFDRVHRTGNKPTSPIIARCTFYKDKVLILKGKSELSKIKSPVYVGEDFSTRVRDIRRKLTPHLKEAKGAGKKATLVYDHILIDGKKFVLNTDGVGVVEMHQKNK